VLESFGKLIVLPRRTGRRTKLPTSDLSRALFRKCTIEMAGQLTRVKRSTWFVATNNAFRRILQCVMELTPLPKLCFCVDNPTPEKERRAWT
jgi:hypothetical protein